MHLKQIVAVLVLVGTGAFSHAAEQSLPRGFDPARHMRVSEVRPGMKGYGLSVFRGTKIERFDVEVLSILRNFNPKYDVVLITCKGEYLQHTGSIAGMSGSPIYLRDDQGRDRMIGAFAYGWPLMKDPVAGVQPIEYMLAISDHPSPTTAPAISQGKAAADVAGEGAGTAGGAGGAGSAGGSARPQGRWSLSDSVMLPGMTKSPASFPFAAWNSLRPSERTAVDNEAAVKLRPLATPLMATGLSQRVLDEISPALASQGLVALQAGGGSVGTSEIEQNVRLEPGASLAVPLLTGDSELTAIGTCTEVLGDRVLGFGHAFNAEGPINLPMGTGYIHTVIANLNTSFKMGSLVSPAGTLFADQTVGIAGRTGKSPTPIPIDIHVSYADGSADQTFHFQAAVHPKLTPLLVATAFNSATTGVKGLPQYYTLDYDLQMEFANGRTLKLSNVSTSGSSEGSYMVVAPLAAAGENPFERVALKKFSGTIKVSSEAREAQILSVSVPRTRYQPGETVKAFVTYRPFRGSEATLPIDFEIPRDLPDGAYQLGVSDWQTYLSEDQTLRAFRYSATSIDEVFDVLNDALAVRHDAIYVRLLRKADGVAVGRAAMSRMPSSRRQVLLGSGSSDVTPFVSSTVRTIPTAQVMSGSAQFVLVVDKNARLETTLPSGAIRPELPPQHLPKPAPAPAPAPGQRAPEAPPSDAP